MRSELPARCWAEIDRAALRHNAAVARTHAGAAELLAIVKANAYGHGMLEVAKSLTDDVQLFGVANVEEANVLRAALPHPIIVLGPALPEERCAIVEGGFVASVSNIDEAEQFARCADKAPALLNVKIDTGMGRMGVLEHDAVHAVKRVAALTGARLHSVSTHLPVSNEDAAFTREQLAGFTALVKRLRAEISVPFKVHALQSAGLLAFGSNVFDIVRPGLLLYGIPSLPEFAPLLRPAMTWKTRICLIRDVPAGHGISYGRTFITEKPMRVATLSAGYADGYPRHISNRGASMLIRGKRCPLLGRVTMDLMVVDVSHVDDAEVGDEVVLMGCQGEEEVTAVELAERADTITWDITTRIGQRVRRIYV